MAVQGECGDGASAQTGQNGGRKGNISSSISLLQSGFVCGGGEGSGGADGGIVVTEEGGSS
jgi:hypothetical protein